MNTNTEKQTRIETAIENLHYWINKLHQEDVPVVFYTNKFRTVENVRLVRNLNLDRFQELEGWKNETHVKEPVLKLDSVVLS